MDIKVNDVEWNGLSKDDQTRIQGIVKGFFRGARIVPDPATAKSGIQRDADKFNPFCKAACDIAQASATAACASLPNPIAIATCIAAAQAAGDECRRRC